MINTLSPEELHANLAAAVVAMHPDLVVQWSKAVIDNGYSAMDAINSGLAQGMKEVGRLFAEEEYFVPEVLMCSRAMYAGFEILKQHIKPLENLIKGVVVIGVVEGDVHDIGKNIVKVMIEAAGFRIVDLGKDVSVEKFCSAVQAEQADIVALSTLMTPTMSSMKDIVSEILQRFPAVRIMIGGAPVSEDFAKQCHAHYYGKDAQEAVRGAHLLRGLSFEG